MYHIRNQVLSCVKERQFLLWTTATIYGPTLTTSAEKSAYFAFTEGQAATTNIMKILLKN